MSIVIRTSSFLFVDVHGKKALPKKKAIEPPRVLLSLDFEQHHEA
jgi:hypothetical protein